MRRNTPGVAPMMNTFGTTNRITNSGLVFTTLSTSGSLSNDVADMIHHTVKRLDVAKTDLVGSDGTTRFPSLVAGHET